MKDKNKIIKLHMYLQQLQQIKNDMYNWDICARPEQKLPTRSWDTWCIIAGRGFGKTRTGAESVRALVNQGYRNIGFIGASMNDVRNIMIEGNSGILSVYPDVDKPIYYPSLNILKWNNGAKGYAISADNPDHIRGYQFDLVWLDEFAKFYRAEECWHQMSMALRLGKNPKSIITTTPKPMQIIQDIIQHSNTYHTQGSTYDNKHLSERFLYNINAAYGNTSFAKQEIYGEILNQYALWSPANILYRHVEALDTFDEINISVDPAVTSNHNSDETGIVVLGKKGDIIYVLEDASIQASPKVWIDHIKELYIRYNANNVIIEVNQGGDLLKHMLYAVDIDRIIEVRAVENKVARAQKAFMLYEKGLVYHTDRFTKLEDQMFNIGNYKRSSTKSPDRLDALTWGLLHFQQNNLQCITDIW